MGKHVAVWAVALALATGSARQSSRTWTFDAPASGTGLADFEFAGFRQPAPGQWSLGRVASRSVLQHAPADVSGWSLAIAHGSAPADLRLSARLRLSGAPHVGGVVFGYRDAHHFSAAVLDIEDGELSLYRVWDGNRIKLDDRDGLDLDEDGWHTMKVSILDGRTTVSIGGIRVLEHTDRRHSTGEGRVGLLVAGRASAAFDDLTIEPYRGGKLPR
ncbi:MAG: hypothetical protein AB7L71_11815 [Vicinamibacterales bacterium]